MVMISKDSGETGQFFLNEWDMRQFQQGLDSVYFVDPDLSLQVKSVQGVVLNFFNQTETAHGLGAERPALPCFNAEQAGVVIAALRANLAAKLPPGHGRDIPRGYKGFALQTARAIRKLGTLSQTRV